MAALEIKLYGNPVLREKSQPVEELTPELEQLVADMAETMYATDSGVGLAAPQVGKSVRLIVLDVDHLKGKNGQRGPRRLQVFFNPEILAESEQDDVCAEGCLSLPDLEGDVYRPTRIRFRARDARFQPIEFEAEGFLARALQHELDHLDGILFIDRMSAVKRIALAGKLATLRKRGRAQARLEAQEAEVVAIAN